MPIEESSQALLDAVLVLAEEHDPSLLLDRIVQAARELTSAKYAAIAVLSPIDGSIQSFVHAGLTPEEAERIGSLPRGRGVLGVVRRRDEPLRIADLTNHPESVGFPLHHPQMRSFLGMPIKRLGRVIGQLYLTEKQPSGEFTVDDEGLVRVLAAQAAIAIENARMAAEEADRGLRSSSLVRAVGALARERDPAAVLDIIVNSARDLAGAEYAALGILGEDGRTFSDFLTAGMSSAMEERIGARPKGNGTLAAVTIEGRPLRMADLRNHPAFAGFPEDHPQMTSFLGVPLMYDGDVFGNLYLTNKLYAPEFTAQDEEFVSALAGQAAIALERARAQHREQETIGRLRALLQANLTLTEVLDQEAVLQTIVDLARDLVDAEYAALGVLSESGDSLSAFIHSGMPPDVVERIGPLPKGKGLLGAVLVSGRPIRLSRMQEHPASVGFPDHHPPMDSFLGVPLGFQGRVLGNLYLTNKRGGDFSDMDEEIVSSLAAQAAVAIENAGIVTRERELVEQLRDVDEMKTEFVSLVSHELRTPLVALRSGAELLETADEDLPDEDRKELRRAIRRQADRLHQLIANLLDLSRIEQGRLDMAVGPVNVQALVADLIASTPRIASADVRIAIVDGTFVMADDLYLRQVLTNLLINALNYGLEPVTISAEAMDAESAEIRVSDEGPGVSPELEPVLFEKFTRGTRDGRTPGSGLGLALVAALVEEFGGTIRHQRRQPVGTTFVVTLPIPQGEPE